MKEMKKIKSYCQNCFKGILVTKNVKYCFPCSKIVSQKRRNEYNKTYMKTKKFKDYCHARNKALGELKRNHIKEYYKLFEKYKK